jgi:hypothetical protein
MLFQKFNEEKGILTVDARGNIDFFEVIDFYTSILNNESLPEKLKIIFDTRQSKFDFEIKYYEAISQAIENVVLKYDIIKEAMIIDPSNAEGVYMMFDDKMILENYSFKVFASPEAAEKWIDF